MIHTYMILDTASPLPHYTVFATPLLLELELHPITVEEGKDGTKIHRKCF
jgi:hypothetical protein